MQPHYEERAVRQAIRGERALGTLYNTVGLDIRICIRNGILA